jgi:hypothetical protein
MQVIKIDSTAGAKRSMAKILLQHFGVEEPVEGFYRIAGGGTNDANHVVARTDSGRQFGIKTKPHGGGQNGEHREAAFSKACHAVGVVEACRAICAERVPGLTGFETDACVVTEWVPDSKRVAEISPEEKQELANMTDHIIGQVGKWVAINLHFGLVDRGGLSNWVWSRRLQRLVPIDTESAWQTATLQDHFSIIDAFYDRRRLKAERGQSTTAQTFEKALKEWHMAIVSNPLAIPEAVACVESANRYASPYASLTEIEFADRVFSGIA